MNFTLCKNRCNYTKRNKQSRNPTLSVPTSQNRTIPPTFRRVSVCVCLYGFASVQNLGHTRLRHPCLACPSRCTQPFHPHNHCKRTIIHRSALNLPPLSKGGGLTARHKLLLRPACDMSALFILQTFLPSRRRDCLSCIDPLHPHNPRKPPTPLPLNERSVGFASHCLVSHQCRCVLQRLSVADFMHPCLKLWAFNFGHPCPPSKKVRQE